MSELSFLGADSAVEDSGSRTKLLLAGAGGLVVLALVAVFVVMPMLSSDSGDDAQLSAAPGKKKAPATAPKKPAAKPAAKAPAPKQVPKTFDEEFQRDPFKPLYVESRDRLQGGGGGGTTTPGSGTTGGGTVVAPGPAPAAGGTSAQVGGNRVALMDVFVRSGKTYAQTKVGTTVHTPGVGDTFASSYRVLSASGTCATYQYGDEQFQLCEGQEVLK